MKVSAALIVKNESAHLRTALNSIEGIDEIVVVDTGSTDNTVEIAMEFTDKVYHGDEYLWRDDFAFHRNQATDLCTNDWIFVIDADEYLEPGGIQALKDFIATLGPKFNAVEFDTVSASGAESHWSIRAFKKSECRWEGRAHNYLINTRPYRSTIKHYYGYSEAHKLDPDRTLRILTKACQDSPESTRERYYLAREYWYRKDYESALKHYNLYLENSTFTAERADALLMKSRCLWFLQRGNEARDTCLQAIGHNPDFREALLFMSEMHYEPWKSKWKKIADNATNLDVLFVRNC
jgi:glycosyltransferase involved in cell wall biosynthesis